MADTTLLLELKNELDELARDLWNTERVPPRLARKCESIMERLPAANAETAQVTDDQIESAAKVLWNRFSPNHFVEWKDEPNKAEYRDAARALSLAPDTAAIRNKALEDYVRVSVLKEPTNEMLKAGVEAFQKSYSESDTLNDWRQCYKAMIAASPQGQEAEKGVES